MRAKNVFTLLLRGRDQGSCAARNPHVCLYAPVPALLFTLLTTSRYRSWTVPSSGTTIPSPLSFCLRVSGASQPLRVVMVPCSFGARS